MDNMIFDFGIEKSSLRYIGEGLQRPECILAEKDGTLWSADSRGGVVCMRHDGPQEIVTQKKWRHSHLQLWNAPARCYDANWKVPCISRHDRRRGDRQS